VTTFIAILFSVATLVLVAGLAAKIAQYARTPAPLKIPTTPAPLTPTGAAFRVAREVVIFQSLFKSNKPLWLFALLFHFGLALVLLRHARYFQDPVWLVIDLIQPFGIYGGLAMMAGLGLLALRRIVLPRIAYITGPSDWLLLILLLAIGASGMGMKALVHTDIIGVKAFFVGLMHLEVRELPADPILALHLALVSLLMIIFPFSKLLHAPGIFFSPTRNQCDNPRERRHLCAWGAKIEATRMAAERN
jgi:nitrate reductase gamma subunit